MVIATIFSWAGRKMNILGGSRGDTSATVARLFWITYRYDWRSPIERTTFTSDSGWGCMIRSGQMVAATALAMAIFGRDFLVKEPPEYEGENRRAIIALFADCYLAPLSIHNIVEKAVSIGRKPGEWHAPSITARCLSDLINEKINLGLRSYCAVDVTVNVAEVAALLSGAKVLIWIPMRLGLDSLNMIYSEAIQALLSTDYSVGIAGGRPNSSLYFVGHSPDGLAYLDPHSSRPATYDDGTEGEMDVASYTTSQVRVLPISAMDPSFVVAFLLADTDDLAEWVEQMKSIQVEGHPLISFTNIKGEASEGCSRQIESAVSEWNFDGYDGEEASHGATGQRAEPLSTIKSVDLDDDTVDIGL